MSLSVPKNPPVVTPAVNGGKSGSLDGAGLISRVNLTNLQQVRGTNLKTSTGSAVPKPVTNVQASVSNASKGATSTVNVQFRRDPSDATYQNVVIYAKGYQGNQQAVQVGSSVDSPATVILNNTGESISLIVQPQGNAGITPLANCPSVGVQLPKSSGGGVGTTTTTQITVVGALTGDVVTVGTAATVDGIQGIPVRTNAPIMGDNLWFDGADWTPNWFPSIIGQKYEPATGGATWFNMGQGPGELSESSESENAPTATEPYSAQYLTPSTAGTIPYGYSQNTQGVVLGNLKRWTTRMRASNTTNARYWVGFSSKSSPLSASTLISNFPTAISMCAFRYSSGTDTNWQAITSNGSSQTIVNTSVAPDSTNSQLFDITWDGTTVRFYINRVLVASSTTNLPSTSVVMPYIVCVDNQSAAHQVGISLYYTFYQEK